MSAPLRSAELREWRRNLYAMWIAQTLSIVGFSFTSPFIPLYLRDLGVTDTRDVIWWAGVMNTGSAIIMALSAPLWGAVADRFGRKPMVLRAMFGGALVIGLMGLAPNVYVLLALRLIQGSLTGTVTASTTLVASITPRDRVGFSLGLMQTAVFSGNSFGPLVGGIIADALGYRVSFGITGALLGLAGVLVLALVRERFERPAAGATRPPLFKGMFAPLSNPLLRALVVALVLLSAGNMAIAPLLPIFVAQLAGDTGDTGSGGNTASLAGATIGIGGLTSAVAAVAIGRIADRVGHRRILVACSFVAGLLYLPQALAQHPWQLIALRGVHGIAMGGMMPTANALIAGVTEPETRGAVYGLTSAASSFGSAVGPLGGATIGAQFGLRAVFPVTSVVLLFISAWVARTLGRAPAPAGGRVLSPES